MPSSRIFQPSSLYESDQGALDEFLSNTQGAWERKLGLANAEAEMARLTNDLDRQIARLETALNEPGDSTFCQLVLGRVQSGKTQHLTGTLAWAADQGFAAAVVLTGANKPLKNQTRNRLRTDLQRLNCQPVKVEETPTASQRAEVSRLSDEAENFARRRSAKNTDPANYPMHIFVSIKKPQRFNALRTLLEAVRAGDSKSPILLIDDEADQISPNTLTRDNEESISYQLLGELRDAIGHHILLSYTATPQSILLSDLDSRLRPDKCLVLTPGQGYFGIQDVVEEDFRGFHEITDETEFDRQRAPQSLRQALLDFFCLATINDLDSSLIFGTRQNELSATRISRSVQFLLHHDRQRDNHALDRELVESIRNEFLASYANAPAEFAREVLRPALEQLALVTGIVFDEFNEEELDGFAANFIQMVARVEIRVINSARQQSDAPDQLPQSDDEWQNHKSWILIGGDMLGRGVTIPNLLTTYFLRQPVQGQYDTTNQQMRFCGYRKSYQDFISIWTNRNIWERFLDIAEIDKAVLAQAKVWDQKSESLGHSAPAILYVSRPGSRLGATRPNVISNQVSVSSFGNEMFQTRSWAAPQLFIDNHLITSRILQDCDLESTTPDGWSRSLDVDRNRLLDALETWHCSKQEKFRLRQVIDLLRGDLEAFSLRDHPLNLLCSQPELFAKEPGDWTPASPSYFRQGHAARIPGDGSWEDAVKSVLRSHNPLDKWTAWEEVDARVPIIGDPTRRVVKAQIDEDVAGVFVYLMPLALSNSESDRVAAGIGLAVVAPQGYKVSVLGHVE